MTALRLLLFRSGGRVFAVDAGAVREVLPAMPSTRIPGAPAAVCGLVNVRGTLVTVVDAAQAIGLSSAPAGSAGMLVLVEHRSRPVGLAVDDVLDLVTANGAAPEGAAAPPGLRPDLVLGLGVVDDQTYVQLATDVLLEPLLP
jgi:purine-binding chemotaxis protein CheW